MLKILLVDDVKEDLMLGWRVLRQCNILNPVHLIPGGAECIRQFEQNSRPPGNPDSCLVFLDMIMPTSGLDVLRVLRDRNLVRDSIFVMLSGITDIHIIKQGYQLGARTFLIKPFKPEDVAELLKAFASIIRIEHRSDGIALHLHSSPRERPASDTSTARQSGSANIGQTDNPPRVPTIETSAE